MTAITQMIVSFIDGTIDPDDEETVGLFTIFTTFLGLELLVAMFTMTPPLVPLPVQAALRRQLEAMRNDRAGAQRRMRKLLRQILPQFRNPRHSSKEEPPPKQASAKQAPAKKALVKKALLKKATKKASARRPKK
jgi:hypothetical protein